MLRFHLPLIEPDLRISRIRLSDGFHGQAHRQASSARLAPDHTVPSGAAESSAEVIGNMATLQTLGPFQNAPEVRPLPSAGITRFQRYYGPLRLPGRAGLSLAGCRLGHAPSAWGLPCCVGLPAPTCRRHYPGGNAGGAAVAPPMPSRRRPSPSLCWVGCHITRFEACSAFTHVTAYRLAESLKRPFPSKASTVSLPPLPLRLLPAGATSCRVGLVPTESPRLGTAHKGDRVHYLAWLCGLYKLASE